MNKILQPILLLLILSSTAAVAADSNFFMQARVGAEMPTFKTTTGSKANYSGLSYGAAAGSRSKANNSYGGGFILGADHFSANNSANTSTNTEVLTGTTFSAIARLYALDVYAGLGFIFSKFSIEHTVSGATTQTDYTSYGARVEVGADFKMGGIFYWAPNIHYDVSTASTPSATGSNRLNNLGAYVGFGVQF